MRMQAARIAWLLAALSGLAIGGAALAQKSPPSSFRKAAALVHFKHSHMRVAHCVSQVKPPVCLEKRAKADASAQISLTPVTSTLVTEPTETRVPISVALPDAPGSSAADAQLEVGRWHLSWADQSAELRVDDGRSATIRLTTVSGRCVSSGSSCERDDDFTHREIAIPVELRRGN